MSEPSTAERLRIALLSARRARARTAGKVWRLPILRWRYGLPIADRFTIIPSDLRVADPSFVAEVAQGQFNLAGRVASLDSRSSSPFTLRPPSRQWARELHGFGWLRHMRVANSDEAREMAVYLTTTWIRQVKAKRGTAWEPAVLGRRITSWINNVPLLLEDAAQPVYDAITDSLGEQLIELSARWRESGHDLHRLQALIALVQAMLCVAGHDGELDGAKAMLGRELHDQIMPDGGHISRNPACLVELLLDCLPLRQCFIARHLPPPPELQAAITSMMSMLHLMRLGDGALARFNGMGATAAGELATVLAYDQAPASAAQLVAAPMLARHAKYARLAAGDTVMVIDAGGPPPWAVAGQAHAGCLSFEMSTGERSGGRTPVFVNGGAPVAAFDAASAAARATASHNTLSINGRSSSKIIDSNVLSAMAGGPPIRYPKHVTATIGEQQGRQSFSGSHDGYRRNFEIIHSREIFLEQDGLRITGIDRLGPEKRILRLARDAPFAIHFHIHRAVGCAIEPADAAGSSGRSALLSLPTGEIWRFYSAQLPLTVEASIDYSSPRGPLARLQIVLRGASFGESLAEWSITRIE